MPEISLAEVFITACAKGRLDLVADCLARGVEVNTFRGKWNISAWDALLDVKYYWSSESPDSFQTFLICVTRP